MTKTFAEVACATLTGPAGSLEDERIIELFAGPGGMSEGLAMLGIQSHQAIGIEWDESACKTAEAAGHRRILGDVTTFEPEYIALNYLDKPLTGFHASPPCQGFSLAGKGKGREDTDVILQQIRAVGEGELFIEAAINVVRRLAHDDKSALTLEPLRWIYALLPGWVTLEQVPAVLPLWEAYADVLRAWGYSVWTGNVQAEQYGVPQTRKRAILIASRHRQVTGPTPTHSKFHTRTPSRLDEGVAKWTTMAEALGWGESERVGFARKYDGRGECLEVNGVPVRGRDLRATTLPAQTVTEKARSWSRFEFQPEYMGDVYNKNGCIRSIHEPAPTLTASMDNGNFQWTGEDNPRIADRVARKTEAYRAAVKAEVEPRVNNQSGTEFDLAWPADRPAPTLACRDLVTMPGANANRFNGSTKSRNDGIRVTVEEAGILQSFPADYPWYGTKTKRFEQVGNAVPPLLGMHVAAVAMGVQVRLMQAAA